MTGVMRTTYHELEPDHLEIHGQLAGEYNRTKDVDFSKFASPLSLDARDFGLFDGTTTDYQALTDGLAAGRATFTDPATGKTRAGAALILPSGTIDIPSQVSRPGGSLYGPVFPIVGPDNANNGGSMWVLGQANGSTTIAATGVLGHGLQLTSATRGANSAASPFTGNTITLGFASAHNAYVGQKINVPVLTRGRIQKHHYSIIAIPDATHVQYKAADVDIGTGRTVNGGDLDRLIPPLTYTEWTQPGAGTTVNTNIWFIENFFEPLQFRQPHQFCVDRINFNGPNTGGPGDGIAMRWSSRADIGPDTGFSGWHMAGICTGTPTVHPIVPSAAQVPQNTDHSWWRSRNCTSNTYHLGFIENSSSSYFRKNAGPGLGGGRDNHVWNANFGTATVATFLCNDAGNFETTHVDLDMKGGNYPILFEGVDGIDPCEGEGIDNIIGHMKIESPGNYSIAMDETKRRSFTKATSAFSLRLESGVDINGADSGTPGGGGSVPQGQFADSTDKPWPATAVSLTTISGMPTITATVPAAMFGVDGGCDIGTLVAIGLCERRSTMAAYSADGVTVAGAAGVGTFSSASIGTHGGFNADDVGLRIDCAGLAGGSDTIKSVTNGTTVVMTGAVASSGSGKTWTVKNDGTAKQSGVCHEIMVHTVTAPSAGLVTVTGKYPSYLPGTGLDLVGPYQGLAGEVGGIRCGELDGWEPTVIFDTQAIDRMTHAQQFHDVRSLKIGGIHIIEDSIATSARRELPRIRVWDAITRGSPANDGAVTGTVFTSPSARFTPLDVGRFITATGLNAGAGADSIASVQSPTSATLTHSATTGSSLAWTIGPDFGITPFRFFIRRGTQNYEMFMMTGNGVGEDILPGYVVELAAANNNLGVGRSTADKGFPAVGVSMYYANADHLPTTATTGTVGAGSARVRYVNSVVAVAMPGTTLTIADDPNQLISGATITGNLLVDNGDGRVIDATGAPPDPDQRVVGFSARGVTGANNPVDGYLLVPYWTT